jgi:hypothetical protein
MNNCTFVWARDGNHESAKEHAAYLLPPCDVPSGQVIAEADDGEDEYVYVRWCSTGTISRIQKSNISTEELSSRRCRRSAAATEQAPTKSKSRLSLSKKQRQHWRDQQQHRVRCNKQDRGTQLDDCNVDHVPKRQKSINEDKAINMKHDVVSIGCRLSVSVDANEDDAAEEKKEDDVTVQSSKPISALPCKSLVKEGSNLQQKQAVGVKESKKTYEHSYTHRSSAYVQHIAEACTIIMSDARWRTSKQPGDASKEIPLFAWEEGDDLSAVKAFISLYENEAYTEVETRSSIDDDIVFERSMNLYSRIFHRKGPWFDLADLYVRYYAPNVNDNAEIETAEKTTSFSTHQTALQNLFLDIVRLESMGLVRSFESEYECGTVVGQVKTGRGVLLSAEERREVLRLLGGGKSPKAARVPTQPDCTNEILAQMQSQKTLLSAFAATKSKTTSLLPVRKHVEQVLVRKLANKLVSLSKTKEGQVYTPKKAEVEMALQRIELEWKNATRDSVRLNQNSLLSTIRLREAPLQTLRRLMRLFLCAGGGPGSMRGDGTNGWRSCFAKADWHTIEYPGLNSRFGLEAYPLQKYFVSAAKNNSVIHVFDSLNDFRLFEIGAELRSSIDQAMEAYETEKMIRRRKEKVLTYSDNSQPDVTPADDALHLLTKDGRHNLVRNVLSCFNNPNIEPEVLSIYRKIEDDIHRLHAISDTRSENENLILCTSLVCRWMLQFRFDFDSSASLSTRPWLRHLKFDAILTYIAWDSIPFFERRSMYEMASSILMTILFGMEVQQFCFNGPDMCLSNQFRSNSYTKFLLPRRNRGKAIERLLIDLTHAHRKSQKHKSKGTTPLDLSPIQGFCRLLLVDAATSCSIPFSSIRNLARRLKAPLICTMDGISNDEMQLLQIRLDNVKSIDEIESCTSYRDWSPHTDVAIANALSNDRNESSRRCAFVGWEANDNHNRPETARSLNVEELALEEYHSARLPNTNDETSASVSRGNWEGWHDEGGHARKLFRIIFLQAVLENASADDPTIFLTPYQHSPHDLHVGYQMAESDDRSQFSLIHGFYERRRNGIEVFLSKLSQQTEQSVCDLVYDSVQSRWDSYDNDELRLKDVPLLRDVAELRTLSMIAAGLGGQALSVMFRALAFDYRHYSGGLPDLLLARARYPQTYESGDNGANQYVQLGEWIGEAFCKDNIEEENLNRSISMLADRDDDFLGCSKNADSGQSKFSSKKKRQKISVIPEFPTKLKLIHNAKRLNVDCMFVEVKSANDRLDARQEDWLNILDVCAHARVCKFESSSKKSKSDC